MYTGGIPQEMGMGLPESGVEWPDMGPGIPSGRPLILIPSGNYHETYGWQVHSTHSSGMLSCFLNFRINYQFNASSFRVVTPIWKILDQ